MKRTNKEIKNVRTSRINTQELADVAVASATLAVATYLINSAVPVIRKGFKTGVNFVSEKLAERRHRKLYQGSVNADDSYDWDDDFFDDSISDDDLYDEDEDFREDTPQTPFGNEEAEEETDSDKESE